MPTRKDKTNIAPIHREQVFIPASGAVKFMQEFRKRTPRGGSLEIVSPEFDLLTGIRGIGSLFNNVIGKKLPLNYAYRRASKQELDDIILSKSFRKIPDNVEVEGGRAITLSNGKTVTFKKAKGNSHGGKAFSAGEVWKGTTSSGNKSSEIIIGVPGNNAKWKVGHHGSYSEPVEFNKISKGEGLFVPFDDNGVADISIKGLKQFTPTRFKNRYISKDIEMKCGGRRKAQLGLDIREGGIAIPIANNMWYIHGRKHENGGVTMGPNNKNGVEVEGGEVVEMIDSNHPSVGRQFAAGGQSQTMRVFSSVPLLRGVSPAQLVLGGANPNKVFKAQEEFKDRNKINDDGTRYEIGGEKKSNSAIRTEEDKKVPARNRAIYSAVDATADYPAWWQAIGLGIGSNFKTIINPDSMNYTVTDSVADAAWRKRLGLSYNDKFLIPNKDGSVRLPRNVEMEIPTDTTMLKKRIAANEKFANQSNIVGEDWQIVQAMMKKDKEALEALRKTYKTGEPVVVNEYAHNNRKLSKNGELIDDAINYKSPLNVMKNYTIQYDPKTRKMNYWDTYDFNEFDWGVPGESFKIKGSIPLKQFGGNMIYTINGNVKNGLSLRPKAEWGKGKKEGKWKYATDPKDVVRGYFSNTPYGRIDSDGESYITVNGQNIFNTFPEFMDYAIKYQANKRPQYYAKKQLPVAGSQSIAEKAGLARSGWSYADNPTFDYVPKINITNPINYAKAVGDNAKKSTSSTPRGGESKSAETSRGTATITNPNEARYASTIKPAKKIEAIAGDEKTNQSVKAAQAVDGYRHKVGANQQYEDNSPDKYRYTRAAGFKNEVNKVDKVGKTNETKTPPTGDGTQSKDGRWVGQYKTTNVGDWIGLGSNLAGSVASYFMTKSAIDKMPEPLKPIMAQPVKLKTKYNIEPQLTNVRETEQMNRASVRRNTQSSNTSLAREQRLMNEARGARNTLYGQKENIETQLINQDRLNRQSVMRDNVKSYNEYLNKLTATKTAKSQLNVSNINNLISGLTGSVNNILGNIESRKATNNTLRAIAAANPNVDARLIGGFDYYIDPITKKKYNKNQQYVGTING